MHLWETNQVEPKPYLVPRLIQFLGYTPYQPAPTFGEWLVMARRANGYSRKRLARRLRVDESTIWRWETNRKRPTARLLGRIGQSLTRARK